MTNLPITGQFNITATFGQEGRYWKNGHKGLDIVSNNRTIYSTCNGRVGKVGYDEDGWGRYVDVYDENNNRHIFCHLVYDSVKVKAGDLVTRSTIIGTMGTTGNSTGIHLHYQINDSSNNAIDPCNHLGIPNKKGTYNSADYELNESAQWEYDDIGWKYVYPDGSIAKEQWIEDSLGWCYVNAEGYSVVNTWQKDSKGWCYIDSSGRAVKNKWQLDTTGWCYIDETMHAIQNDWLLLDGRWYYFNDDCNAVTGFHCINNKLYYFTQLDIEQNNIKPYQLIITNNNGEII